jgi:hypothetical protein
MLKPMRDTNVFMIFPYQVFPVKATQYRPRP